MVEMSLNVDLMGGLWPAMPAPAPASDDDFEIEVDVAFAAILHVVQEPKDQEPKDHEPTVQGPTVPEPTVPAPTVQGSTVHGPRFEVVQGARVQGPRVQGSETERPDVEVAATSVLRPELPAPSDVHAQVSLPEPLQQPVPVAPAMHTAAAPAPVPTTQPAQPAPPPMQAAKVSQPAPVMHALPVSLPGLTIQPQSELDSAPATRLAPMPGQMPAPSPEAPPAVPVHSDQSPSATQLSVVEPARATTISAPPGFSPAEIVGLKPDVSNDLPLRPRTTTQSAVRAVELATPTAVSTVPRASNPQRPHEGDEPAAAPVVEMPAPRVNRQSTTATAPVEAPVTPSVIQPAVTAPAPAPVATAAPAPVMYVSPAPVALQHALVPTTEDGAPVPARLVEMMRWQAREGGGQAELRLRPEFLGAVTVSIVVENGAVKATVSAETSAALEYLRSESSGLQEALEERGLTLDEFEVREESPLTERRRHDDEEKKQRQEAAQTPRRRVVHDSDAVFSVLA